MTTKMQMAFANKESQTVYNNAGDTAGKGKIWHLPGETRSKDFKANSIFGSDEGVPDESNPIAAFASVMGDNGIPKLDIHYYDNHQDVMNTWRDLVKRYGSPRAAYKQIKTSPAVAAVVNKTSIDETKSLNIMDQVLGYQVRSFFLENCVYEVAANQLVFTVDRFTDGSVEGKVPEMKEPNLISHSEERTTKILYKNVGHIAETEEARLMALHNTMQLRQDKTVKDMGRLLNAQVGTELEKARPMPARDWGAMSGTPPDSANNPVNDINDATTLIQGNGFNVDYLVAHDVPVTNLSTNKFVAGRANIGQPADLLSERTTIPGLPPVLKDQALTNTVAIIGNKEAVWMGKGPTVIASYEEEVVGYSGWLIKQWRLPYLAEPDAIRKLTGVSA